MIRMKCIVVAEQWRADGSRKTLYANDFTNFKDAKKHFDEIEPKWSDPNVHCDIIVRIEDEND